MPESRVREDVEKAALVGSIKPEPTRGSERSYAIYRTDMPPGPAGSWLISWLPAQAAGAPEAINQRSILSALRHL
jgi:DNA-binding transcriptional LysR family regulator